MDGFLLREINSFNDLNTRINFNKNFKNSEAVIINRLDIDDIEMQMEKSFMRIMMQNIRTLVENSPVFFFTNIYSLKIIEKEVKAKAIFDDYIEKNIVYPTRFKKTKKGLINRMHQLREDQEDDIYFQRKRMMRLMNEFDQ